MISCHSFIAEKIKVMQDNDTYEKNRLGIATCTFGLMLCIARQLIFIFRLNQGEHQNIHIYYPVLSNTRTSFHLPLFPTKTRSVP